MIEIAKLFSLSSEVFPSKFKSVCKQINCCLSANLPSLKVLISAINTAN